jgi:hypothetical protein
MGENPVAGDVADQEGALVAAPKGAVVVRFKDPNGPALSVALFSLSRSSDVLPGAGSL